MQKSERISIIEYLRGIAIIAVMLIHTFGIYSGQNFFSNTPLLFYNVFIANFVGFAVPLFILISGFVLTRSNDSKTNLGEYYFKRFKRVVPAYILISFIYSMLRGTWSVNGILFELMTGTASFHLWFVPVILQFYFLYPFIGYIYQQNMKHGNAMILLCLAFFIQVAWNAYGLLTNDPTNLLITQARFLSFLFYFILGIFCADRFDTIRNKMGTISIRNNSVLSIILTVITSLLTMKFIAHSITNATVPTLVYIFSTIISPIEHISIFILCFNVLSQIKKSGFSYLNGLRQLGNNAYPIYLLHILFLAPITSLLATMSIYKSGMFYNILAASLLLTISYFVTVLLKKIPLGRSFFGA